MAANSLLTLTMITREALRLLHNNLVFAKGINRQYSKEFAVQGAKIGTSINVRKPNKYTIRTGTVISIQGTAETYAPLTLDTQAGVDTEFSSQDLTLSLDDFGKRILSPACARISSKIDFDGLAQVKNVYNSVGTPGTTPGTSGGSGLATTTAPAIYLNAGMMLDNFATPRDENRRIIMNPIAQATSVSGLSGLFNDQTTVAEQYRKGVLGMALGFEFGMDQNINLLTTGTRSGTTLINGTTSIGSTIDVDGYTGATDTVKAGETLTIAGVYSLNPENGQSTGQLQQFTVTADTTAASNETATLPVSPSLTLTGPYATVNSAPANNAAVTFSGSASTAYPMNVAYHQDSFTLGTADLILPGGVDFAARETYDGISMRIVRAYDIVNDLFPCRIDVLYGYATLRPEMACRIWG